MVYRFLTIFIFVFLLASGVFAGSTITIATDTDFSFFALNNIAVAGGTGAPAYLSLENRWLEVSVSAPAPRHWFSLSADTSTHKTFIFGGRNALNPLGLNDLWVFNPSAVQWSQKSTSPSPARRYGHKTAAMGSGRFLLFGGLGDSNYYNDTWIYDSNLNTFTDLNFSVMPSSRAHYSLAVDTKRNKIYVFGGTNGSEVFNDLWVYDIPASSWSKVTQLSTPPARYGAEMVYLPVEDKILLFGGNSGVSYLGDLWYFNIVGSSWTNVSQGALKPVARQFFGFVYNEKIKKPVLFGGERATIPNLSNEIWIYNFKDNIWSTDSPLNTPPAARYGFGMTWHRDVFLFGGAGAGVPGDDGWMYIVSSSGNFISNAISVFAPTGVYWQTLALEPISIPSKTERKFQVSVSADGINWSAFAGPNEDPNQFFIYAGAPINIDWSEWQNKPNIRVKGIISSDVEPQSARVDSMIIRYNRPPYAPLLISPLDASRTNNLSPSFSWNKPGDPDGDSDFTYNLQISTSPVFSTIYFSSSGISALTSVMGVSLYEGKWYWRIQAKDQYHAGVWSGGFELNVDTTSPAAVSNLAAQRGSVNGQIILSMNVPGDDGNSLDLRNASCIVRFSLEPLISESDWILAAGERITPIGHLAVGSPFLVNVDGLNDATTYYFNLRIRDNAGNTGPLFSTSPSARTNAPPSVNLVRPSGGEVLRSVVGLGWHSSEPEGDTYSHFVHLSSDGGATFGFNLTPIALGQSVTFYSLNTMQFRNGASYVVKIIAKDDHFGLSSSSASGVFSIQNPNEPPSVEIIYPKSGSVLSGHSTIYWTMSDLNLADNHTSVVYISSNQGKNFGWRFISRTTFFLLNTINFPNSPNYTLKIVVSDDGSPSLRAQTVSELFNIKNNNLLPHSFSLISPPDKTYRSALNFTFVWEKNGDPNPEDIVRYKLIYSTNQSFANALVVENIHNNEHSLSHLELIPDATYWWKVVAIDPFGLERASNEIFEAYILNRFKASTEDNFIICEVVKGMPDIGFLRIENVKKSHYSSSIIFANRRMEADPFTARLVPDIVYYLSVCDINLNEIKPESGDFKVNVYLNTRYRPKANQKTPDLIETKNLRIAVLDENISQWVLARNLPLSANGKIKSTLDKTGYISAIAAFSVKNALDGLFSYPNPFDPLKEKMRIIYTLAEESDITVRIYSLTGDLVLNRKIKSGDAGAKSQPAGYQNNMYWDGRNDIGMVVANGMYILEIKTKSEKLHSKIGVIKK